MEDIELNGELKNFKEQVVQVVFKWKSDGKYFKDSCTVKQSKYLFKAKLSEPTWFSLQPKYRSKTGKTYYKVANGSRESFGFFLEPKKIHLTSINSFTNTICSGSEANKIAERFMEGDFKSSADIQAEASKIFYSLHISTPDSLECIDRIYDSLSIQEDVLHFKQNANSILGPYLINKLYDQRYSVSELKKLFNLLSDEGKQTNSAKLLIKQLNSYAPLITAENITWFSMPDTSGTMVNTANLQHEYMLIDFWASWCSPCRKQIPQLRELYSDFHKKGFEVVAVSLDEKLGNWKKAIADEELPWVNVSDLKGWNNDLIVKYYINAIPFNLLVDKNGKILAKDVSMEELRKTMNDLTARH